jgi:arylsulfatase
MAVAWAWAFDTPFKWTKQIASHFGGTRQGMAISWPDHIKDTGGIRPQFHHVIDIVPTILEATSIPAPEVVDGIKQKPIEGVSMMYTFDSANAPTRHKVQYFEMAGNRGIYNDGWYANTHPPVPPWELGVAFPSVLDYRWELYNLADDYSQYNDLAVKMPDKLKEMQALFAQEADKYQVYPLDNAQFQRAITPRPSAVAGRTVFTYVGENPAIPDGNAPSILNKSFTITADIEVPEDGGNGMIVTDGGRFGGYGLFLLRGKPVFVYNFLDLKRTRWESGVGAEDWLGDSLKPGKHTIEFDFTYDGPGVAKSGTGVLKVDGRDFAKEKIDHTIPFLLPPDETFDVGIDNRTPVDSSYEVPFRFTGKIDKLTFNLGPSQLSQADDKAQADALKQAEEAVRRED